MRWAQPSDKYRKPKQRCEFCNADIETPYKGIHDETELILGIPVKCRNNGKANIHLLHGYINEQPRTNIKYFIEDPITHKWFTGYTWTTDPHDAFACEFEWTADRYARLKGIEKYVITEHMFI